MRYEQVKALKAGEFKRLCGVKSETFERMVAIVRLYNQNKQKPPKTRKNLFRRPSINDFRLLERI